jgi:hypothetical protein
MGREGRTMMTKNGDQLSLAKKQYVPNADWFLKCLLRIGDHDPVNNVPQAGNGIYC